LSTISSFPWYFFASITKTPVGATAMLDDGATRARPTAIVQHLHPGDAGQHFPDTFFAFGADTPGRRRLALSNDRFGGERGDDWASSRCSVSPIPPGCVDGMA